MVQIVNVIQSIQNPIAGRIVSVSQLIQNLNVDQVANPIRIANVEKIANAEITVNVRHDSHNKYNM